MTDEHSRLIRYFNVVSEGSIDLQFQVNYVYNFNGNVLSLNDGRETASIGWSHPRDVSRFSR